MSVFSKTKKDDFINIIKQAGLDIDPEYAYTQAKEHINMYAKGIEADNNVVKQLENRWYESLPDTPDYSVYGDPYYVCDIWACWKLYSRDSVNVLTKPSLEDGRSVVDYIGSVDKIIDLGCGLGYTTALLKEIYPDSKIYGTNLEDTWQFDFAKDISINHDFKIITNETIIGNVDIAFASEYFEHFPRPVDHVKEIIEKYNPRFMITANGFTGTAIGHFNEYYDGDKTYNPKQMSRRFNNYMREVGYKAVKTKIWNNRPFIWEKVNNNFNMFGD